MFESAASLTRDQSGVVFTRSGTVLSGADTDTSDGDYYWSGDYYSVDLVLSVRVSILTFWRWSRDSASANVGIYDYSCGWWLRQLRQLWELRQLRRDSHHVH